MLVINLFLLFCKIRVQNAEEKRIRESCFLRNVKFNLYENSIKKQNDFAIPRLAYI